VTITTGPCTDWPVIWPCDLAAYSPEVTGIALSMASNLMWSLSGQQYGTCSVALRPCLTDCGRTGKPYLYGLLPWSTYGNTVAWGGWDSSWWFPGGCGSCGDSCSCARVSQLTLPALVSAVTAVKVDGVLLPSTAYRLDNSRLLVRTDGSVWPRCNNLNYDDTHAGTWSVTADYGVDIPSGVEFAVGQLACEILKATTGADCQLPANVTQLIRQGVTITMPSIAEMLSGGRTGLYLVDLWLEAVNPYRNRQRARTFSVDRPSVRRTGT
jgi:hypothetical protein